jgi:hypothetical protein
VRVVAVFVEIAAAGLTKIPISVQVGFLSRRIAAAGRPLAPILSKNRKARERINVAKM